MSSRPTYMWSGTEWLSVAPGIGDEGGITDHQGLTGRTDPDSHPIDSITDLQPALDDKSDITHTHQGLDLDAGVGISIDGVDPTVISNTDLGSEAVDEHIDVINNPDPHSGVYSGIAHLHAEYSLEDHLHDGTYSPTDHLHGEYAEIDHEHLYLPLAGGNLSGPLILPPAPPQDPFEAVGQQWVLDQISVSGLDLIVDGTFDTIPDSGPAWDTTLKTAGATSVIDPASPLDGNAAKTTLAAPTDQGVWQQKSILVPPPSAGGISGSLSCAAAVGIGTVAIFALYTFDDSDPVFGAPETVVGEISSISINPGVVNNNFTWEWVVPEGASKVRIAYRLSADSDGVVNNTEVWLDNCSARWQTKADTNPVYGVSLFRANDVTMTGSGVDVVWGSKYFDEGGFWEESNPTKGIRIPPGLGGIYDVRWAATFEDGAADSYRQHTLRINGTGAYRARTLVAGTGQQYLEMNRRLRLNEGDYLDTQINNAVGSNPNFVGTNNAPGVNVFEAWKIDG